MNRERAPINPPNELLFDGHATYGYDLRGNRIFKTSKSKQHLFHYDPLNRLIAVETELKKPGNKKGKGPKKQKKREYPDKRPEQMLHENPGLKETTHPEAAKTGHRMFENPKTGEKFRYDLVKPAESGHEGRNHWHQYNPDPKTNHRFPYLDKHGNPVKGYSPASHLYFD